MTTEEILQDSVFYQEIMEKGGTKRARKMLSVLLETRFGPIPRSLHARIMSADDQTLDRWAMQVLTAPTAEAALS